MIIVALSTALAGGGGAYAQVGSGAAWSDVTGPLIRGNATHLDLGGYFGPYKRTMRYGRFVRLGIRANAALHTSGFQTNTGTGAAGLSLSVARGFDLMNVGYWVGASAGPAVRFDFDASTVENPEYTTFGALGRAEFGGLYNIAPALGIGLRFELGVDWFAISGMSMTGGLGLTVLFRAPVVTPRRALRQQERPEENNPQQAANDG